MPQTEIFPTIEQELEAMTLAQLLQEQRRCQNRLNTVFPPTDDQETFAERWLWIQKQINTMADLSTLDQVV